MSADEAPAAYIIEETEARVVCRVYEMYTIEGLSIGGFDDPEKETAAHKVLLGAKKLIIEDIRVPEALLDGKRRHFAAFPVLIQGAGGAWTRAVAWDEGEIA